MLRLLVFFGLRRRYLSYPRLTSFVGLRTFPSDIVSILTFVAVSCFGLSSLEAVTMVSNNIADQIQHRLCIAAYTTRKHPHTSLLDRALNKQTYQSRSWSSYTICSSTADVTWCTQVTCDTADQACHAIAQMQSSCTCMFVHTAKHFLCAVAHAIQAVMPLARVVEQLNANQLGHALVTHTSVTNTIALSRNSGIRMYNCSWDLVGTFTGTCISAQVAVLLPLNLRLLLPLILSLSS